MKKILVDVNETYLEQCRKHMEHRFGVDVSNSQLVGHMLFLHHDIGFEPCQLCGKKEVKNYKETKK